MLASAVRLATAVAVTAGCLAMGAWSISIAWSIQGLSRAATSDAASVLSLAAGGSVEIAGMVGVWRRPMMPGATLMIAAGIAWFVAEWSNPGAPAALVFTIGLLAGAAWPALLAHAAIRLGRTKMDRRLRLLVVAGYAICVGLLGVLPAIAYAPAAAGCTVCPSNLVGWLASPAAAVASVRVGFVLQAAWVAALATTLGLRIVRRHGQARQIAAAVQVPALMALMAVAVDGIHGLERGSLSNDSIDVVLWAISAVGLIGVAAGSLLPVVRAGAVRRSVVQIALDIAAAPPVGEVQRSLADILDDSALTISFPLDAGRSIDATGREFSVQAGGSAPGRSVTTVTRDGVEVARIDHRADLRSEGERLEDAVSAARLWLENERLHAIQLARMEDLRRSRADVVAAADAERWRIERDLHDGSQQRLVALAFELSLAQKAAAKRHAPTVEGGLADAEGLVRHALADLRELARGLYPRALVDQGLGAALEDLASAADIPVILTASTTRRFDRRIEVTTYHVASEVIRAGLSQAAIALRDTDDRLCLEVIGHGPGPTHAVKCDLDDRALVLDGSLTTGGDDESRWIRLELPCGS